MIQNLVRSLWYCIWPAATGDCLVHKTKCTFWTGKVCGPTIYLLSCRRLTHRKEFGALQISINYQWSGIRGWEIKLISASCVAKTRSCPQTPANWLLKSSWEGYQSMCNGSIQSVCIWTGTDTLERMFNTLTPARQHMGKCLIRTGVWLGKTYPTRLWG